MAAPKEELDIDMGEASSLLSKNGDIKSCDDMMLVMSWKGMEVTVYRQGKIMFHPLDDRDKAVTYADEILSLLT